MPFRVAAISFLNPAPLLYDFEHEPGASRLRERYTVHYTSPARCAEQLARGAADLGLIPVAALTSDLAVVPGCAIASLETVRSILLLVRNPHDLTRNEALQRVRTVAADSASRSSTAYTAVLLRHLVGTEPTFAQYLADPGQMLESCDAALLIGDPALLAREQKAEIEHAVASPLLWLDIAALWREAMDLPWIAAVWAVRPEAMATSGAGHVTAEQLIADLAGSRDAGLRHIDNLVREWTPRIALPPAIIREYLTRNIHYQLDPECLRSLKLFRQLAAEAGVLPPLPTLRMLQHASG